MNDTRYEDVYRRSIEDPDGFWLDAARAIDWSRPPTTARSEAGWFADGMLNSCYNAVDRHVEAGRGNERALVYDSPITGSVRTYSFVELREEVARVAGMIADAGVGKGDRVVIYMPMVPETAFAMLACARIGAVHSVVFGGFAARELAKRIDDCEPRLVLAASCGIEPGRIVPYKPLLDEALEIAGHKVPRCLILQRKEQRGALIAGRDEDWEEALARATPRPCVDVAATDPLYVLYTSGTTGVPKGVVRDNGGHAVALVWSMSNVYGMQSGDTFWAASDVGWVVGHSYIVYGPLMNGCTAILYEGKPIGTPDAGAFWRVIRDHDVDAFFCAPTAIRAIRREDPEGSFIAAHGIDRLRVLFLAGERADPETVRWCQRMLQRPVIDHWWQTELGWPAIATCFGLGQDEVEVGSAGFPVPGYAYAVLDESHAQMPPGTTGDLCISLPLPPGCLTALWQNPDGYRQAYMERHPGYYSTGDSGFWDENGRLHIMSRIDDIINVAGHRLSTAGIEQIVASHAGVAECAVVGLDDALKGMVPVAVVVPRKDAAAPPQLARELVVLVREELGPVASFKTVLFSDKLPKTRSGKILRATIRDIGNGKKVGLPPTLEDPTSISAIVGAFAGPQAEAND